MDKLIKYAIIFVCILVGAYIISFVINCIMNLGFDVNLLVDGRTFAIFTIVSIVGIGVYLYNKFFGFGAESRRKKRILEGGGVRIAAGLENADYMEAREIKQKFVVTTYSDLPNQKDGIVLKCVVRSKGDDMDVHLVKPIHTLTIGTTGSGKTEADVINTLRCNAHTKTKPSFIISDPKGELLIKNGMALKKEGYEVLTLDLRNPYHSTKWNPLEGIYERYHQSLEDSSEVNKQIIYDELYEELNSIAGIVCPVLNKNDIWDGGAKNYVLGILMAMLEDSANQENGMTKERFNFYNMAKIAFNNEDEYEVIKTYFNGKNEFSKAKSLANQVIGASENTLKSYMSTVADKLLLFNDRGVCSMTSKNELNISDFDEKPTAVFLLIPDERETRHPLASLFIMQSYKELVKKANGYKSLSLKRNVYYILDEFGNLPKLPGIDALVTVGRSRGIFLCPYVQSYAQLENKYGKEVAAILKSNCNIKKYIGTDDKQTNEEFSQLLGNYSIVQSSVSGDGKRDLNVSDSIHTRPLVYPTELAQLNNNAESGKNLGNTIISQYGFKPIRSKFTPFFMNTIYDKQPYEIKTCEDNAEVFNEQNVFYDIKKVCEYAGAEMHENDEGGEIENGGEDTQDGYDRDELIDMLNDILSSPVLNYSSTNNEIVEAIDEEIRTADKKMKVKLNEIKRRIT